MSGITLDGKVVKVDHIRGSRPRTRNGVTVDEAFDYHRVRFFVEDDGEMYDVKYDHMGDYQYQGDVPNKGEHQAIHVSLSPYKDETTGRALLAFRALRPATARPAAVRQAG